MDTKYLHYLTLAGERFLEQQWRLSIEAFTHAIRLHLDRTSNYMYRAVCHAELSEWMHVKEGCERVIQDEWFMQNNDYFSLKAHSFLGLASRELGFYADSIFELEKSVELATSQGLEYDRAVELWEELDLSKFKMWEQDFAKRLCVIQKIKETCSNALKEANEINQLGTLDEIFSKGSGFLSKVSSYMFCPITLCVFRDPVIVQSGTTYERTAIVHHLNTVWQFDPSTHEPLFDHQLIPNRAMKEVAGEFIKANG